MTKHTGLFPPQGIITRTAFLFLLAGAGYAQLSSSAYRVLGQLDFRQAGVNMVLGTELNSPSGIAFDTRGGPVHLYVADTRNSRVLAWPDVSSYQTGDPPALVLGQPGPRNSNPLGIGVKGFNAPLGLAVDPTNGNLYVADFGNNRVLRFPSPFDNPSRIEPDRVYGQPSFTARTAVAPSSSSLNGPRAVAVDSAGNLWVADSGNNRVLRFSAAMLDSSTPPAADTVIGQKDFVSGSADGGGSVSASGLHTPAGLIFDAQNNLYVSDSVNARVLKFSAPLGPGNLNPSASGVWGQSTFTARGVPAQASSSTMAGPVGLALDGIGNLYVAVPLDNRVLIFPLATTAGAAATKVLGQSDFTTTTPNTGATPMTSQNALAAPWDVKVVNGTVFIADSGNHRVLGFQGGSKSATQLWGQTDFSFNGQNQIKPASLNFPDKMAIDYSTAPFPLYVSDTGNNRVLVWKDSAHFRSGDPADLVIGQPNLRTAIANVDTQGSTTPSSTSLSGPAGIAVNPSDGSLYVADSGNNRVLRFPRPVDQSGRITPDGVIGQADFTSANSAAVNSSSFNAPTGLALGPTGDLFVSDAGNNRVLEFAAGAGTGASAIRVYGQPNMNSSVKPTQFSAQTLWVPQGIAVDAASNLYVADTAADRVLIFPNTQNAPAAGAAAAFVIGQSSFATVPGGGGTLGAPADVGVDSIGNIYIADLPYNRVLVFPPLLTLPPAGAAASGVIGQPSTGSTTANRGAADGLPAADSLFAPAGLFVDRQDTLYVGDAGNSRLLHFLKPADVVNAATIQPGVAVAPGGIAALCGAPPATVAGNWCSKGGGLAGDTALATGAGWPLQLASRQIVVNDEFAAPIYYMSPNQANFQVPSATPLGSQRIALRIASTAELVAGGSLVVAAESPGIFTFGQNGAGQAAAVNENFTINGKLNPAPIGSTISLYGTGQGQVSPPVPDGVGAPSSPPFAKTVAVNTSDGKACFASQPSMCVAIGAGFGTIQFSGLAPGTIGLWQINVTIPTGIVTGDAVPVRVVINGTLSNVATIAIK